jgi:ubiquinone/menaquinone biosynthesis C-methylase UbiE
MEKQVNKDHYDFEKYCYPERWESYYHQIKESLALRPKNILEIGSGDKFFGNYIKTNTNIEYKSLDIAGDLSPDIIGSVDNMPIEDGSFDLVCAFEVLEHLPFEKFEKSISEIKRVSRRHAIISLPHFGPVIKFSFKIPFLRELKFAWKIPYHPIHKFNGQHYWEIGKNNFSNAKIKNILEKNFKVTKDFIPFDSQYHHFYILEK